MVFNLSARKLHGHHSLEESCSARVKEPGKGTAHLKYLWGCHKRADTGWHLREPKGNVRVWGRMVVALP